MDGTAVVLMAYGSPQTADELVPYLRDIRGGQEPSPEQVADLERRYDAIGGRSPLLEITRAQARELQDALSAAGVDAAVWPAMKHTAPSISQVVAQAFRAGARSFLGVALAPQYSGMGIGGYERSLRAAVAEHARGAPVEMVRSWHLEPHLIAYWAGAIRALRRARPGFAGPGATVVFSAHSLPARIVDEGDPYPDHFAQTGRAVARAAEVSSWSLAWQSAGSRGEWIGPTMKERLEQLAGGGTRAVISAPVGFVSDHLEVLYDLDIEAREAAEAAGLRWARLPMPNASPALAGALSAVVGRALRPREGP